MQEVCLIGKLIITILLSGIITILLSGIIAISYFTYFSWIGVLGIIYLIFIDIIITIVLALVCFIIAFIIAMISSKLEIYDELAIFSFVLFVAIDFVVLIHYVQPWVFAKTGLYSTTPTIMIFIFFGCVNIIISGFLAIIEHQVATD